MTHETEQTLTEAVAKALYDLEPRKQLLWFDHVARTTGYLTEPRTIEWDEFSTTVDGAKVVYMAQATAAIAAVRQHDEQSALNCGHCTPNADEIACGCQIEERDDE